MTDRTEEWLLHQYKYQINAEELSRLQREILWEKECETLNLGVGSRIF
jgi:protein involved in temperature-dependent protein secretion